MHSNTGLMRSLEESQTLVRKGQRQEGAPFDAHCANESLHDSSRVSFVRDSDAAAASVLRCLQVALAVKAANHEPRMLQNTDAAAAAAGALGSVWIRSLSVVHDSAAVWGQVQKRWRVLPGLEVLWVQKGPVHMCQRAALQLSGQQQDGSHCVQYLMGGTSRTRRGEVTRLLGGPREVGGTQQTHVNAGGGRQKERGGG